MEKSKRTFRGSYPAYALTYFFFYWSLGVFTSVLSMYLTGIGKSKAEMSFIMSASSLFVIIGFVFSGCSNLNMTYSPILLQELGMPTGAVGTVLFFSTIVELPVILFSYKFMDRFSGRTLMLLAFAIMVAQFLLYATAPNAFVAVVTMLVLRAIGSTLFGMILLKIVRGVVQVRSVSTALGVISATDAMSAILMQNLGGILVENTSIRILYFAMAGLMMLGMILTLFLRVQNTEKVFS